MTQREALKNILTTMLEKDEEKIAFLTEWLEDINWHAENRNLCEIVERHEWLDELVTDELRQKAYREQVRTFNYIYGWGIDSSLPNPMGSALVIDLLTMAGLQRLI